MDDEDERDEELSRSKGFSRDTVSHAEVPVRFFEFQKENEISSAAGSLPPSRKRHPRISSLSLSGGFIGREQG